MSKNLIEYLNEVKVFTLLSETYSRTQFENKVSIFDISFLELEE